MLEFDLEPGAEGVAFNLEPGTAEAKVSFRDGKMRFLPGIEVERIAEAQLRPPADGGFVIAALALDYEPFTAIGGPDPAIGEDELFFTSFGRLFSGRGQRS